MAMPPFRWNAKAGRYVRPNGTFVSWADVTAAIDAALEKELRTVVALASDLRNGLISLETWRADMRAMIKSVHLISGAAAKGGWAQLTQADYGRIGQIVRGEYGFLEQFAQKISSGARPLDGNFKQYAQMYAQAGRDTYHQVLRATMSENGMRYEENVRHALESCGGCLAESARGRVRIGKLVPIGRRQCLRNCKCTLAFFEGP
jgi:hypothetical protein